MQDTAPTTGTPKLAAALARAQGAFEPIPKNRTVEIRTKTGSSYRFRYADLEVTLAAVRKPLSENGLAISSVVDNGQLVTSLMHESGEHRDFVWTLPKQHDDIKNLGASISYLRRYAVNALLNLAADDDLDENGEDAGDPQAGEPGRKLPPVRQPQQAQRPPQQNKPEPPPVDYQDAPNIAHVDGDRVNTQTGEVLDQAPPAEAGPLLTPGQLRVIRAKLGIAKKSETDVCIQFAHRLGLPIARLEEIPSRESNAVLNWLSQVSA